MKAIIEYTTEELTALAAEINAELSRRSTVKTKIRIAVRFHSYNARRYSRPWIGRIISWPVGGKAEIEFGKYLGDDDGGEAEIMAFPGEIIRYGQKDGRGNSGSNEWAMVTEAGEVEKLNQAQARERYTK